MKTETIKRAAKAAAVVINLAGATTAFGMVWNRTEGPGDVRAAASLLSSVFWPFALSAIYFEKDH